MGQATRFEPSQPKQGPKPAAAAQDTTPEYSEGVKGRKLSSEIFDGVSPKTDPARKENM